jgi:hypothetical protein
MGAAGASNAEALLAATTLGAAGVPFGGEVLPTAISGVYADGDKLVMVEGCEMPHRCPVCNSEEVFETVELNLRRDSKEMGGISGMIKAGADVLAGWNYTGPVSVAVYFCERHRVRFRNRLILSAAISLASVAYLVYVYLRFGGWEPNAGPSYDVVAAVVGTIGGVVMILVYAQSPARVWFRPRRFVDRTVWVSGACREFLESLPKMNRR